MTTSNKQSMFYDLIAGGASGILAKTVSAPIERVKILLQTQHINSDLQSRQYKGLWDCIVRVYQEQGLFSFWRGNLANIYRYFPNQALNFAFKDKFKTYLVISTNETVTMNPWQRYQFIVGNLIASGTAGAAALSVSHPFDVVRTRLASDVGGSALVGQRLYTGFVDCTYKTFVNDGIRGLYSGFGISLVGAIIFRAFFMGGYDIAKYTFKLEHSSVMIRLITAQTITTIVGTVFYPLDTIRRRLMTQESIFRTQSAQNAVAKVHLVNNATAQLHSEKLYRNSWHCFQLIWKQEGIRGLFSGLSANLIRGVSGSVLLVGYDEIKKIMY